MSGRGAVPVRRAERLPFGDAGAAFGRERSAGGTKRRTFGAIGPAKGTSRAARWHKGQPHRRGAYGFSIPLAASTGAMSGAARVARKLAAVSALEGLGRAPRHRSYSSGSRRQRRHQIGTWHCEDLAHLMDGKIRLAETTASPRAPRYQHGLGLHLVCNAHPLEQADEIDAARSPRGGIDHRHLAGGAQSGRKGIGRGNVRLRRAAFTATPMPTLASGTGVPCPTRPLF